MTIDLLSLKPIEVCRLINSTPLGQVLREQQLRNHRTQSGLMLGSGKTIHLIRYSAWLVQKRHQPKQTVAPPPALDRRDLMETLANLIPTLESTSGKRLSERKKRGIAALLTHPTQRAAAQAIGISANTLCRWLRDREFRDLRDQLSRDFYETNLGRAAAHSSEAMETVITIAQQAHRDSDRLRACTQVLDMAERAALRAKPLSIMPSHDAPAPDSKMLSAILSRFFETMHQQSLPAPVKIQLLTSLSKLIIEYFDVGELKESLSEIEEKLEEEEAKRKGRPPVGGSEW